MFKVKTIIQQLNEERQKNILLANRQEKLTADIDYIAMMSDVELEEENDE